MTILRVDTKPEWNQERGVFMYPVLHMLGDSVWVSPRRDGIEGMPGSSKAVAVFTVNAAEAVSMYDFLETDKVTWWLEEIWNELAIQMRSDATMTLGLLEEGVVTYAVRALDELWMAISDLPAYYRTQVAAHMFRERKRDLLQASSEGVLRVMSEELQDRYVWDRENIHRATAEFWYRSRRVAITAHDLQTYYLPDGIAKLDKEWGELRNRLRQSMIEIGDEPRGVFDEQA